MTFKTRHDDLRANENVMRWYRNLQQGSPITGDVYLRTLGLYCKINGTTPERILEDAKSGKLRNDFMDFVFKEGKENKAGSYIVRFKKVINSWVAFNGYDAGLQSIKIQGANTSPTLVDERPPSKDEIDAILRNATVRGRAIISLLAFSGLRPESLGNYDGSDAVRLKDIEGLKVSSDGVEFSKLPAVLRIRQSKVQLSKKGHKYFTFIPEQSSKYIKDYLDMRLRQGEKLNAESPVISTDTRGSNTRKTGILATAFLLRDVRDAIEKSGLKFRPYALRVYWASAMDVAEAKGLVSHNWREFWMGHTGDISARYSTNKVLPPDTVEAMRETYKKCEKYITTEIRELSESDAKHYLQTQLLLAVGYRQDEIEKMDLASMSNDDFQKLLRDKVMGAMTGNGSRQKVVPIDAVENYLSKGYEFQSVLPNGKAIMKLPF
jgi:integrase